MELQGNRIAVLESDAFQNIPEVETLILSHNSITNIEEDAFSELSKLRSLDLSFNRISELKPYTFNRNSELIQIRLSHNYIKAIKLRIPTVRYLDVSHCEIQALSAKDLVEMPRLATLDISHNWLSTLPNNFVALALKQLDVSKCGIWTLNNSTFAKMPNLEQLQLQGNRLSYQIGREVFQDIKAVYLGDNPWRCECDNVGFLRLYEFLKEDGRVTDYYDLLCRSPVLLEGKHWYEACGDIWVAQADTKQLWAYTLVIMLLFGIAACILWHVLRSYSAKKKREQQIVRQLERQDAQARLERMRREAYEGREDENRNAPDPRDVARPPSYAEAVLLPPVPGNMSVSSLSCATPRPDSVGLWHSTPTAESCASTTPTSTNPENKLVERRNKVKNKRRRSRRRSAALDNSNDGSNTSKITQEPESRAASTVTSLSPVTTEREDNSETSSNIVRASVSEFAESSV